jgi:threonyl-tRNA synthetase
MIKVTLDQGSTTTLEPGATVAQALEALGLRKDAQVVAARINGDLADLSLPLPGDCTIAPIRLDSPEGLEIMRHSAAHLIKLRPTWPS